MADQIRIRMFGGFSLFVNDGCCDRVLAKARKGTSLWQYLILRQGDAVKNERLIETLWPREENANPENALKTLVSRYRALLNECAEGLGGSIVSDHGGYRFRLLPEMTVDLYEFERLETELEGRGTLTAETEALFGKAISLYAGDLLCGDHREDWAVSRTESLHGRYIRIVYAYLTLLKKAERYEEIIRQCRVALENDPLDERLQLELLQALTKTGRSDEAAMQYRHLSGMHFPHLGDQTVETPQDFYRQIIQAGDTLDINLDTIREELMDFSASHGAYECEYAIFREIYNLQVRNLERLGSSIFLAVVMLSGTDGRPLAPPELMRMMDGLSEVLRGNLRKGDTLTRFRPSQYALLLPTVSTENGHLVMERLKRAFYRRFPDAGVMFNYRLGPLYSSENAPHRRTAAEYASLRNKPPQKS